MEILKTEGLTRVYGRGAGKVVALDNVSFSVEKGEFVAIVGASGSGKSTLLHLMGGLDRPTEGRVIIRGTDIFKLSDDEMSVFRRKNIGMVYQFYNLLPTLTVEENVKLPLSLDGRDIDEATMTQLLTMLGLEKRRNHLPSQLSGGQQQRTSIARALVTAPGILLADEPTGNLDSKASREIVNLFQSLNEDLGQTIVMITHDMSIASKAHRIIRIEDGRIAGGGV